MLARLWRLLGYKRCPRHGWVWASGIYCPICTHYGWRSRLNDRRT